MSRFYKPILALTLFLSMTVWLPQRVRAQNWVNGQDAIFEIGQTGFNQNPEGATNGANGFYAAEAVVVDTATGKVFITDSYRDGVLRFSSTAAMQNGAIAEAILGLPDFSRFGDRCGG